MALFEIRYRKAACLLVTRDRIVGTVEPGEQLCRACGLCCDGTLFDLVKLEAGDDAGKVKMLGLPVKVSRGKVPLARFPQPCAALCEDRTCRLYKDRPWQCRVFECGVFKDAKAGRITWAVALRLVKQARQRADKARRLLRELGDTDEHRSLGERFHRTSERLEAGTADDVAKAKFADLSLVVHRLKLQTLDKFYTRTEASPPLPEPLRNSPGANRGDRERESPSSSLPPA